ncbi:hypothetical protein HMPREF0183_2196 [Brevibacterium mcbrellneri ATCC 49030]|uniref:Glycoside-hydrolase family GH114 TIM-barrel domain-containing protein n=1 Tax=Brevibacterium mcbrellneri ATCC 49030 TaxID=585530 RepID=D4YQI6_9MICO|nr:endo alpha-1,4 polygalactosaminidase [Brevibacterium mcbrellneri]EFG46474.1 hypothetical protein HMPREF0183_2196 [Brevibacterium mcbrellneri ATCC 49030]
MARRATLPILIFLLMTSGCSENSGVDVHSDSPEISVGATSAHSLPPITGVFDYQLGGAYSLPTPIDVVVRDASAEPLSDAYSVCYVNGFQTQPDDAAMWKEHADLLLHNKHGDLVTDPDWDDEYILDPSTPDQRADILKIISPIITGCANAGYDAVEIDNLDSFDRFAQIEQNAAMTLASAYVEIAHDAGLAIAQKNAAEIARSAHEDLGFDFAVTEECGSYDECDAYTSVYGPHVLEIEYPDSLEEAGMTFADVCALPDRAPLTILRDRALVARGAKGYRLESC